MPRCRTVPHGAARCRTVPHGAATVPRRTEKHHSYTLKRSILLTVPHGAAIKKEKRNILFLFTNVAAPCGTVSKIERFKVYEWYFSVRRGTVRHRRAAPCGTVVRHRRGTVAAPLVTTDGADWLAGHRRRWLAGWLAPSWTQHDAGTLREAGGRLENAPRTPLPNWKLDQVWRLHCV